MSCENGVFPFALKLASEISLLKMKIIYNVRKSNSPTAIRFSRKKKRSCTAINMDFEINIIQTLFYAIQLKRSKKFWITSFMGVTQ